MSMSNKKWGLYSHYRLGLKILVYFYFYTWLHWSFHNSTYDFFTSYETWYFIVYLTKSWGLEKNIELCCLFWFVIGLLEQYFFSILNSWSFLTLAVFLIERCSQSRQAWDRWFTFGKIWDCHKSFLVVQIFSNKQWIFKKSVSL